MGGRKGGTETQLGNGTSLKSGTSRGAVAFAHADRIASAFGDAAHSPDGKLPSIARKVMPAKTSFATKHHSAIRHSRRKHPPFVSLAKPAWEVPAQPAVVDVSERVSHLRKQAKDARSKYRPRGSSAPLPMDSLT